MLKNPTLRQISLYSSLAIALVFLLIYFACNFIFKLHFDLNHFIALGIGVFASSYFIVLFCVRIFVQERVKLIYKNIHTAKLGVGKSLVGGNNEMDQVEKDVNNFVKNQDREIESLKSMENYRREFLGNISHELKTPIFNIQGYVHTLIEGGIYDSNINLNYLQRAAKNADRLKIIVDDLTEISKLESGQLELDFEDFDIRALVSEVYRDQEFITKEQSVSLVFNETTDKSFSVYADKENIRQVLMNLITNAVKYNRDNGRVKASFYAMGQNVLIEIADNGPGIEEQHLPHLFERFYRADAHRSREVGGSGLGLSIVKHIIEAHKQTINVRSTIDVGTTFGFTLLKSSSK